MINKTKLALIAAVAALGRQVAALGAPDGADAGDPGLVLGVPMSRSDTGALQLERLHRAGLRICLLPELADVDTAAEAERIAAATPASHFAARVRALGPRGARPLVNTN